MTKQNIPEVIIDQKGTIKLTGTKARKMKICLTKGH